MTALLTTADVLHAALDKSCTDQATRSILADWYEDQGDWMAAECLRWLVKHNVRPYYYGKEHDKDDIIYDKWSITSLDNWYIIHARGKGTGLGDTYILHAVPVQVFRRMNNPFHWPWPLYDSRRACEEAVIDGWKAARQEGWQPDE